MDFDYSRAFNRNIGLLSSEEQERLKTFTIAIPGMGGVGGAHLISLVRQGFERFKIADLDTFSLDNFNRQYGADLAHIGRPKVEVMRERALEINPNCSIEVFPNGVVPENLDTFLEDVDLAVDGLDAFAFDIRRRFFMEAHKRKVPVITAGPLGFSCACLIFMPEGPTFDDYFALRDGMTFLEKMVHFYVGLVPAMLQRSYMLNLKLEEKKGPSSIGAVNLCAGMATVNALKILLGRGKVYAVPHYQQFDAYKNRYALRKLRFGNRGPLQRIKIRLALRTFSKRSA